MPICPICDDTGLQNSDPAQPQFCYCSAGKQARRQWEANRAAHHGRDQPKAASFIDIAQLEEVNASVDAMRASLIGAVSGESTSPAKHPVVLLLNQVAHAGHEISVTEATQLYELARTLEGFLTSLAPIGRYQKR
ncbi:MAG: hypothetical protein H0W02_11990 [Ktedonobacteraceae bacterium]|nr:hypothetical protein [Ktedonobacteraceae bacterium]